MLDLSPGLELSQADAVAQALAFDSLLQLATASRLSCRRCVEEIDAARLAVAPNATWCTRCVDLRAIDRSRRA
ncbi:hypothetical protein [Pseudomonas aeruginosa]|uniref:hypothetical protein n=1 Tax=Pseudomonas aeruginosa TaxID=287 RepID=UPI0038923EBD